MSSPIGSWIYLLHVKPKLLMCFPAVKTTSLICFHRYWGKDTFVFVTFVVQHFSVYFMLWIDYFQFHKQLTTVTIPTDKVSSRLKSSFKVSICFFIVFKSSCPTLAEPNTSELENLQQLQWTGLLMSHDLKSNRSWNVLTSKPGT
jgi:hypothetical protein